MGPGQSIDVQVTGTAGVPAAGAAAVSLNVTVTQPTAQGYLTVYPTGEPRPLATADVLDVGTTRPATLHAGRTRAPFDSRATR